MTTHDVTRLTESEIADFWTKYNEFVKNYEDFVTFDSRMPTPNETAYTQPVYQDYIFKKGHLNIDALILREACGSNEPMIMRRHANTLAEATKLLAWLNLALHGDYAWDRDIASQGIYYWLTHKEQPAANILWKCANWVGHCVRGRILHEHVAK